MENMTFYNALRKAPETALKPITAGDLKGKSDINPQWRIEALTTLFGACGFGWATEVTERWIDNGVEIDNKGQILSGSVAWVRINLYVCNPETHEWSRPIVGLGGSKITGIGRGGKVNEEAWKMAETDAISVACKKLGVAADVYWDTSTTKYSSYEETPQIMPQSNQPTNVPTDPYKAIETAKTEAELRAIWADNVLLQSDAKFITAINTRLTKVK